MFSVVIPARNAAGTLGNTIEALRTGTRSPDEILVVDGCSTDETAAVARHSGAIVVINRQKHAAAGRQLGTEKARGEIIAFTDADCLPAADWLQRIAANFDSQPDLDGVGGKVTLKEPCNEVQAYSAQVFEMIMQFPDERVKPTAKQMRGTFAGANCAYRRAAILGVGGFRDFFSNHAEEVDLFWRLIETGADLLFDPHITVEHLDYANTVHGLIRTNFNYGIASTKLAREHIGQQVDLQLYYQLARSALCLLNPMCKDPWSRLRTVQIGAFVIGKICASIKYGTLNV